MEWITEVVAEAAVWGAVFLPTTLLVTAVVCAGAMAMLLALGRVLKGERWTTWLALYFAILMLQYFLQALNLWQDAWALERCPRVLALAEALAPWAHRVLSPLNNLLILAAAAELLGWPSRELRASPLPGEAGKWSIKLVPLWAWAATAVSLVAGLCPDAFWRRAPDAALSAAALALLARAIYLNAEPNRRRVLSKVALWGLYAYALVNLVFAFSPLVARGRVWPELRENAEARIVRWAQDDQSLASALIVKRSEAEGSAPDYRASVLRALDAGAFALALLFKGVLLIGIAQLAGRSLIVLTPKGKRDVDLLRLREDEGFLSEQGVVRALGQRMGADFVAVYSLLPGGQESRVAMFRWLRTKKDRDYERTQGRRGILQPRYREQSSVVAKVLEDGEEKWSLDLERDSRYRDQFFHFIEGTQSFATFPIRYHNAVIGCLNVEWKRQRAFTATGLLELREATELLAPVIQAQRELGAIHDLLDRLRLTASTRPALNHDAMADVANTVLQVLSPAAVGMHLDYGFRSLSVLASRRKSQPKRLPADFDQQKFSAGFSTYLKSMGRAGAAVLPLILHEGETPIGRLELASETVRIPGEPAGLISNDLLRKTVGLLITDTIRRIVRRELDGAIGRLAHTLEQAEPLTYGKVLEELRRAALAAGIEDVSLRQCLGRLDESVAADSLSPLLVRLQQDRRFSEEREFAKGGALAAVFGIREARGSTLLRLDLQGGEWQLWALVARGGFGPEVEDDASPWWQFFEDLAAITAAALTRIEREKLRYEAEEQRVMAVRVAMSAFAIHDVGNWAIKLEAGLERVRFAANLTEARTRAEELSELTQQIAASAASLREPGRDAAQRVCLLQEVFSELRLKHEAGLAADDIRLTLGDAGPSCVALPKGALLMVLDNLIANARREILGGRERGHRGGSIRLAANQKQDRMILEVADDGPGVPSHKVATLFDFGRRNWGLPISRWILHLHKSELSLAEASRSGATTFLLNLPLFLERSIS